jgi:hypothetical protein
MLHFLTSTYFSHIIRSAWPDISVVVVPRGAATIVLAKRSITAYHYTREIPAQTENYIIDVPLLLVRVLQS